MCVWVLLHFLSKPTRACPNLSPKKESEMLFLLVSLLFRLTAGLESCSQFQAVQGVEVNIGVTLLTWGQWNSTICSSLHPKSVMVVPNTQALGTAMCDMFGNSWPWGGIYFDNNTSAKWIWTDGANISTKPALWAYESSDPNPAEGCTEATCIVKRCGEICCDLDSSEKRGKLYNDPCSKIQDIICQVDCKLFHCVSTSENHFIQYLIVQIVPLGLSGTHQLLENAHLVPKEAGMTKSTQRNVNSAQLEAFLSPLV
jgi:hypothetical protein